MAHRGSSAAKAEHTLGAYVAALDEGADALECDVRLTADGHLVCVRDRDLRRCRASARWCRRWSSPSSSSSTSRRGSTPGPSSTTRRRTSTRSLDKVLTLRRLLETVADYPRRVELAIETERPTRYAGLVERRLVETLDDFGWATAGSPARVMSFSWVALRRIRRLAPDLEYVMLVDKARHWPMLKRVVEPGWIIGPGVTELAEHPGLGRRLRKAHKRIHVWTVNTDEELQTCLDHEVEAVITDRPAYLLSKLGG